MKGVDSLKCKKIIAAVLLTAMFGIFAACHLSAYAADETLTVNAAWADGDLLKIQVTDKDGVNSTLALRLSDYVDDTASEYISIQAVDLDGNTSGVVQVKNPYYEPDSASTDKKDETADITVEIIPLEAPQSGGKPLTPDGSGTVMDDVFDNDGKEIFSITTEDGNVFFLIVDRQRTADNVYLLNAVTEEDLIALAEKSGRTAATEPSVTPTTEAVTTITEQAIITTTTAAEPEIKEKSGGLNRNTIIFVIIAFVAVGGAGYYFKIHKNKKKVVETDDDDIDDYDDKPGDSDEDGEDEEGDDDD